MINSLEKADIRNEAYYSLTSEREIQLLKDFLRIYTCVFSLESPLLSYLIKRIKTMKDSFMFWVYYWITYGIAQFVVYLFKKFKVIEFIKESGLLSAFEDKSFLFMIIFGVLVTIISIVIRCVIEHKREKEVADIEEEN